MGKIWCLQTVESQFNSNMKVATGSSMEFLKENTESASVGDSFWCIQGIAHTPLSIIRCCVHYKEASTIMASKDIVHSWVSFASFTMNSKMLYNMGCYNVIL